MAAPRYRTLVKIRIRPARRIFIDGNQYIINQCKPLPLPLNVQGKERVMEYDTGSAVSCISYDTYLKLYNIIKLM